MRKMNESVSPNKQELAQGCMEVNDEESLAQVRGEWEQRIEPKRCQARLLRARSNGKENNHVKEPR
jgi:hypothetical protein